MAVINACCLIEIMNCHKQVQWLTLEIPEPEELKQEDHHSLGYSEALNRKDNNSVFFQSQVFYNPLCHSLWQDPVRVSGKVSVCLSVHCCSSLLPVKRSPNSATDILQTLMTSTPHPVPKLLYCLSSTAAMLYPSRPCPLLRSLSSSAHPPSLPHPRHSPVMATFLPALPECGTYNQWRIKTGLFSNRRAKNLRNCLKVWRARAPFRSVPWVPALENSSPSYLWADPYQTFQAWEWWAQPSSPRKGIGGFLEWQVCGLDNRE